MRHDFADGKYTVTNDNGILTALRHGEPWGRDLVGDNLVYWMLIEVDRLKAELEAVRKAKQLLSKAEAIGEYVTWLEENGNLMQQSIAHGLIAMAEKWSQEKDLPAILKGQAS